MSANQERRDALERTIAHRLPACDEAELRAIDAALVRLEQRRHRRVPRRGRGHLAKGAPR